MISRYILVVFILIILLAGPANAKTLEVGPEQTYKTIQSAVDTANTGDVISISEGTYYENILVKTSGISIIGKNREKTIIDGKKLGSGIRIDQADNVRVSDLTVLNTSVSGKEDAAITLYTAKNNEIMNIILKDNIMGISLYSGSNNNLVSSNEIGSSVRNGIFIFSSSDNRILNNNIKENKFGIYSDSGRTNQIYSNNFINNENQAYDNSGLNSWDNGETGNYWEHLTEKGPYIIPGGRNVKDNFPVSKAIKIEFIKVTLPENEKEEPGNSTPGFESILALFSLITIIKFKRKTGRSQLGDPL